MPNTSGHMLRKFRGAERGIPPAGPLRDAMRWWLMVLTLAAAAVVARADGPGVLVFPGKEWVRITPREAGLDTQKFEALLAQSKVGPGGWGGHHPADSQWGAVLTRGGCLVCTWGDPSYRFQSASLGKCLTRALFGITVEAGLIDPDEPIRKTWTGRGQLSHPHKYLDEGCHRQLTWRQLLEHQGGFVLECGGHWRTKTGLHEYLPIWARWTGDPLWDNYAHTSPGTETRYSSGGYWRLGQALTAVWKRDLKEVLQEKLIGPLGIPADRWDWLPGKVVHDTEDFYPSIDDYGAYIDPPYEMDGHVVRGGPGWIVMSAEDLARFGLLVASRGVWNGQRLVGAQWLRGHAGLDIHVVAGDPETMVSIAKINTKGFPFGREVGTSGQFAFPKELIARTSLVPNPAIENRASTAEDASAARPVQSSMGTPVKQYMNRQQAEPLRPAPRVVQLDHGILHYNKKTYCGHPREAVFGYFGNGEIVVGHHHAPCNYEVETDVEHGLKGYHGRAQVLLQRSLDYGKTWPEDQNVVVYDETLKPQKKRALIWQPDAHRPEIDMFSKDSLFFFAKTWLPERKGKLLCLCLRSGDRGRTWEDAPGLVMNPFQPEWDVIKGCHPVLRMRDGKTLLAAMEINMPDAPKHSGPALYRSRDQGVTWDYIGVSRAMPQGKTTGRFTYANLLCMPDGELQCYYLDIDAGYVVEGVRNAICMSISRDDGKTWTDPIPVVGKGQGCWKNPKGSSKDGTFDAPCYRSPWPIVLQDGRILVLFARRRAPSGIGGTISADHGKTWSHEFVIRDDGAGSDLGYPVACQFEDGRIFVAYYYTMADGNNFGGTRYIARSIFRIE